jgi:hypothetical protein
VQDAALDQATDAIVVYTGAYGCLQVVLFPSKAEKSWAKTLNALLVQKGLAGVCVEEDADAPKEIDEWYNLEEVARDN